jgi:hypothetical protein
MVWGGEDTATGLRAKTHTAFLDASEIGAFQKKS